MRQEFSRHDEDEARYDFEEDEAQHGICHCQEEATDAIGLRATPPTPKYEGSTFSLTRIKLQVTPTNVFTVNS